MTGVDELQRQARDAVLRLVARLAEADSVLASEAQAAEHLASAYALLAGEPTPPDRPQPGRSAQSPREP